MQGYLQPPDDMVALVDEPNPPHVSLSRCGRFVALLGQPSLRSIAEISKPRLKLAGLRFTQGFVRCSVNPWTSLSLMALPTMGSDLEQFVPKAQQVTGLPDIPSITHVQWSPTGKYLAVVHLDNTTNSLSLFVVVTEWAICFPVNLELPLTAVVCAPVSWTGENELMVQLATNAKAPPPPPQTVPNAPTVFESVPGAKKATRTLQDLLRTPEDDALFKHYTTSTVKTICIQPGDASRTANFRSHNVFVRDSQSEVQLTTIIASPMSVSPDGKFVLVSEILEPFSHVVHVNRFAERKTVCKLGKDGALEKIAIVSDLPAAESIPIKHGACREGRRSVWWMFGFQSTLGLVQALDKGRPDCVVPHRDQICMLKSDEDFAIEHEVMRLADRFNWLQGLGCDENGIVRMFVGEDWSIARRLTRHLVTIPSSEGPITTSKVFSGSREDRFSYPGMPVSVPHGNGRACVLWTKNFVLLRGDGATREGDIPFVRIASTSDHANVLRTLFLSPHEKQAFEEVVTILPWADSGYHTTANKIGDCVLPEDLKGLRVLVRSESQTSPPNYRIATLSMIGETPKELQSIQVSHFKACDRLSGMTKEVLTYKRADDVALSATLYLPPGFDRKQAEQSRLPVLIWAYPREYKDAKAAEQLVPSPYRYTRIRPESPLMFLTQGWAVMVPSFPILGKGGDLRKANDTYREQLILCAEAAVLEVCHRARVGDDKRIVVGGHSYGAFMAANLLCHAPHLFRCGIARSGAYNRTLTPFGFQSEERNIWEASDIYMQMSPFMQASKIRAPLLLIHGEEDENSGTFPEQSERMFRALQALGVASRFVLLPKEGHHYAARESVLHMLAECDLWVKKFCKPVPPTPKSDFKLRTALVTGAFVALCAMVLTRGK